MSHHTSHLPLVVFPVLIGPGYLLAQEVTSWEAEASSEEGADSAAPPGGEGGSGDSLRADGLAAGEEPSPAEVAGPVPVPLALGRLPAGTRFARQVVNQRGEPIDDSHVVAGATADERLIYSNTLGREAVEFPGNTLIADDITTSSVPGCQLTRLAFDVTGRVDPSNPLGGAYGVSWAVFTTCPYSVMPARRSDRIPTGLSGFVFVPDELPRTIEVNLDQAQPIPTHLWLALVFSRANAGAIMGAPALEGFSGDAIDFPG